MSFLPSWLSDVLPSSPPPFEEGVAAGLALSAVGLAAIVVGRRLTLRYPTVEHIPPALFEKGSVLRGRVVHVGDGDNFRMVHLPTLSLVWPFGSAASRAPPRTQLSKTTLHIRLSGVDAPEVAHFGSPGQPYGEEAKRWLGEFLVGKVVKVRLLSRDHYQRAVATAWVRAGPLRRWKNVSVALVQAGYGTVYIGTQAEYDGVLEELRAAEAKAKKKGVGQWSRTSSSTSSAASPQSEYESPMAYKKRIKGAAIVVPSAPQTSNSSPSNSSMSGNSSNSSGGSGGGGGSSGSSSGGGGNSRRGVSREGARR